LLTCVLLQSHDCSRDGKLVGTAAAAAATTPGGTPGGNAFSQFVKVCAASATALCLFVCQDYASCII
jgi:hypothetical protein